MVIRVHQNCCFWLTGTLFKRDKSTISSNLHFLICWQNCLQRGTENWNLSSSQTLYPCSLHSRVSQWPDSELFCSYSSSLFSLTPSVFCPSSLQGYGFTFRKSWWRNMQLREMEWTFLLDPYLTTTMMESETRLRQWRSRKMCLWFAVHLQHSCVFTFPSFKKADLRSEQDPLKSF